MVLHSSTIDATHSKASFTIKKLGVLNVEGSLTDFSGQIHFDASDLANATFEVCVSTATIDTGSAKRDEHLKGDDFFAVNNYPKICFQSTDIEKADGVYLAKGKLTILNTTKDISMSFTYDQQTFNGQFSLDRLTYGLGKKFPAFFIGKTVQVSINCKIK